MRDVHCCQVPTAAMETQCAAFHHPLHSKCYWCIAPKQVPKAAVPLLRKLRHLHCYCIVRYIVQCWLLCFMVFPVEITIKQLTRLEKDSKTLPQTTALQKWRAVKMSWRFTWEQKKASTRTHTSLLAVYSISSNDYWENLLCCKTYP